MDPIIEGGENPQVPEPGTPPAESTPPATPPVEPQGNPEGYISIEESLAEDGLSTPAPAPVANPDDTTPPADPTATPPVEPTAPVGVFARFKDLLTKSDPEFKIPEEVIAGDEQAQLDYMANTFTSIGKAQADEDPFITEYREAISEGATKEDFLKNYTSVETQMNLPSRDFMIQHLTNKGGKTEERPDGWSADEVIEYVDGLSRIDLDGKVETLKGQLTQTSKQNIKGMAQENATERATRIETMNTSIDQMSEKLFAEMKGVKDIGGIPHTPEMQERFKQAFLDNVKVNPETGKRKITELLADNKKLYELSYLNEMIESGILTKMNSEWKQQFTKDFLNKKVRVNPRPEEGASATVAIPSPEEYV